MELGDSDDEDLPSLKGAKGALAMEVLRGERRRHPDQVVHKIRAKASEAVTGSPAAICAESGLFQHWVRERACLSGHKVLAFVMTVLANALDLLWEGDSDGASADLSLAMLALDQVTLDQGSWEKAWLLTMLPEPAWSHINSRSASSRQQTTPLPFSELCDSRRFTAIASYLKDMRGLAKSSTAAAQNKKPPPTGKPPTIKPPPPANTDGGGASRKPKKN